MAPGRLKLALFGRPVAHSLSPRIHAAFAARAGISIDYRAMECPAGELAARFQEFAAAGGAGANLTVPVKTEGLEVADTLSDTARRAGAVNTLVRGGNGWAGHNTDGAGLLADLDRQGLDPTGRRVLILGAGGAVAGIMAALLARKPAAVRVINRSPERARTLARRFAGIDIRPPQEDTPRDFDLMIQATSLGHAGAVPTLDPSWLAPDAAACDLNYGPAHRPFAAWCAGHGLACADGLGMLVEQAAASFELWTGKRPDTAPVLAELQNES